MKPTMIIADWLNHCDPELIGCSSYQDAAAILAKLDAAGYAFKPKQKAGWASWAATTLSCLGAALLSINVTISPWAYAVMLAGSLLWVLIGIAKKDVPMASQWFFLTTLNIIGVWRWLL